MKSEVARLKRQMSLDERYRAEMAAKRFIDEFCAYAPGSRHSILLVQDCLAAWRACVDEGSVGDAAFCVGMSDRGFSITRRDGDELFAGLVLSIPRLVAALRSE